MRSLLTFCIQAWVYKCAASEVPCFLEIGLNNIHKERQWRLMHQIHVTIVFDRCDSGSDLVTNFVGSLTGISASKSAQSYFVV